MRRRNILIVILVIVVIVIPVGGYLAASTLVYNRLTVVNPHCNGNADDLDNLPSGFDLREDGDASAYFMPNYEAVSVPSRDAGLSLAGWYIPADTNPENALTVIVVHGLNSCRYSSSILLAAGMLHRNGFNTLLIDLRDHGDSTVEDGRYAGGTEEYRDVLGAWDWLVSERGILAERIGLLGTSLGGATVLMAAGKEPRVAAVWEDSSYADINVAVSAELARNGFPQWLAPGGLFVGRLMTGYDITSYSPLQAINDIGTRALYITHGTADTRLSVQYAYDLATAANVNNNPVEPWIVTDAEHVEAMFLLPDEYETRLVAFYRASLGE